VLRKVAELLVTARSSRCRSVTARELAGRIDDRHQRVGFAPGVGFVALAVAVAALVAVGWPWRSTAPTRVNPGPATMELRDETPALVDLLTGGFRVEDDAVPAAVVDLAAVSTGR
jgi:hypothetical protein